MTPIHVALTSRTGTRAVKLVKGGHEMNIMARLKELLLAIDGVAFTVLWVAVVFVKWFLG